MCKILIVIDSKCGWNLLPQIWPCNIQLYHWPHVWFWTPHLQEMGFLPLGSGTKDQVLLTIKESYSSCMAISHFFASSFFNTSSIVWSSFKKVMVACSTSLVATHQSWGHSLSFFWGLSLCPSYCGSFKPSSCGGTNFSSEENFDVDSSPSTFFANLSIKDIWLSF